MRKLPRSFSFWLPLLFLTPSVLAAFFLSPYLADRISGVDEQGNGFEGYTSRFSSPQGEKVTLLYSVPPGSWSNLAAQLTLFTVDTDRPVFQKDLHTVMKKKVCASYFGPGCLFPNQVDIDTRELDPGLYYAVIHDEKGVSSRRIYFNLKPATARRVLLLYPSFTWQAYTVVGGASLHLNQTDPRRVSLQRPFRSPEESGPYASAEFVKLFRQSGWDFGGIDSQDLHEGTSLLDSAKVLVVAGHDAYWTSEMRERVERFLDRGGKVAIFSGRTCWWKARREGEDLWIFKSNVDPEHEPRRQTGSWSDDSIRRPEESTFGQSFRFAGFALGMKMDLAHALELGLSESQFRQAGGMQVLQPEHPIFLGTGLKRDGWFGVDLPLVDGEVDGVPLRADGSIDRSRAPLLPDGLRVLAASLAYRQRVGSVGIVTEHRRGRGTVLHLGTTGWYKGLRLNDRQVERITHNAIEYLLQN